MKLTRSGSVVCSIRGEINSKEEEEKNNKYLQVNKR